MTHNLYIATRKPSEPQMDIRTAGHITYGNMPTNPNTLERAQLIVREAVTHGYVFGKRGDILATPSCPDEATAQDIRNQAAAFLLEAERHENATVSYSLSSKAYALLDAIPARWQGPSEQVERFYA